MGKRKHRPFLFVLLALECAGISFAQQTGNAVYCTVALNTNPQLDFFSKVFTLVSGLSVSNYDSAFLQWIRQQHPEYPWGNTSHGPFVLDKHCTGGDKYDDADKMKRVRDEQMAWNNQVGHVVIEASWP
jgi:hypothetical protein